METEERTRNTRKEDAESTEKTDTFRAFRVCFPRIPRSLLLIAVITATTIAAQTIRNPKLSGVDLAAAQKAIEEAAGASGEMIYATRIDAVARGSFDSLIVVYSRMSGSEKEVFVLVRREASTLRLALEGEGRALPRGDRFLRLGLRHEEGRAPMLRLMAATRDAATGEERQRNLDFQFDGREFKLIGQSVSSLAR